MQQQLSTQQQWLLQILHMRFAKNKHRHGAITWQEVEERLLLPAAPWNVLLQMEATGGEPDVVEALSNDTLFAFCDCAAESPKERRSLCYDAAALASRKEHKPRHSAVGMAAEMGLRLLNEAEYLLLQTVGDFDCKTSSWLLTPPELRAAGGALFGDKRYGRAFIYHNGAESYYAARGFRGIVWV
ncbi:MAG: DUF4256 domain-containing protein [Lacibacter sp.]